MADTFAEAVEAIIRKHVYCDAEGLSPNVASVFLCGFDRAAAEIAALHSSTHRPGSAEDERPQAGARQERERLVKLCQDYVALGEKAAEKQKAFALDGSYGAAVAMTQGVLREIIRQIEPEASALGATILPFVLPLRPTSNEPAFDPLDPSPEQEAEMLAGYLAAGPEGPGFRPLNASMAYERGWRVRRNDLAGVADDDQRALAARLVALRSREDGRDG